MSNELKTGVINRAKSNLDKFISDLKQLVKQSMIDTEDNFDKIIKDIPVEEMAK